MPEWDAEREVQEGVVRQLIADQFPDLVVDDVRPLARGWDSSVWLINHEFVFRFPRRPIALTGIEREIMILPDLEARLPLAVPAPTHVGHPGAGFPWPFTGAPFIRGSEPAVMHLDGIRANVGTKLARFLRTLHHPSILDDWKHRLPHDPLGRADMRRRVPLTAERLDAVNSSGLWRVPGIAQQILDDALALPDPNEEAVVHGDLHVRHVLLEDSGEPVGIIDWGDVCVGDPAIDLSLYWSLLDLDGRSAFEASYGGISGDRLTRARVLALFLNAVLALYAAETHQGALLTEAVAGLDRTVFEGL